MITGVSAKRNVMNSTKDSFHEKKTLYHLKWAKVKMTLLHPMKSRNNRVEALSMHYSRQLVHK
jgi:hypothetical protein